MGAGFVLFTKKKGVLVGELELTVVDTITPRQLTALKAGGQAIYRTAHIGNQYLSNLLLASIGLPLYLYDKTTLSRDKNYHPGIRIIKGIREELATSTDTLVPYAKVSADYKMPKEIGLINPDLVAGQSPIADSDIHSDTPANIHYRALKQLFGDLVFTESELFLRHKENLHQIFSLLERYDPTQFDRYVFPCGCMVPINRGTGTFRAFCPHNPRGEEVEFSLADKAVELLHTLRDLVINPAGTPRRGGVVPSLPLAQVACALVGWWESGKTDIFELSGPDMIRYAPSANFRRELASIFSVIVRHGDRRVVPSELVIKLVPTASFRFGHQAGDGESFFALWLIEHILKTQNQKQREVKQRTQTGERMSISSQFHPTISSLLTLLQQRTDPMQFYEISQGKFFSHHDLLPNKKLAVPDIFLDMTFAEMQKILERLRVLLQNSTGAA